MGALAAWTDRVRLVTTVMVPQLHDPVMLANAGVTDRVTGSEVRHQVRHNMRGTR
jgi:alkanesulfonate monooxygenase SsuD/methylene tetrahydromethanopterin reductase-like flavin-dependent oxidoreductase (luciferase family)